MSRPLLLDLFCGAGGMAKGYHDAGFEVVGVDLYPQPHYPYTFYQDDALKFLEWYCNNEGIYKWDAVHASPPCQAYSTSTKARRNAGHTYPELIEPTRALLKAYGRPYVIENVVGAPLENPIMLCGTMFPGLRVLRHRLFETNFPLPQPGHPKPHPLVMTHDKRKPHYRKLDQWTDYVGVYGGGQGQLQAASEDAMGIDWMTRKELNQAIPPAYAEYVGRHLMAHLDEHDTIVMQPTNEGGP